MVWCHYIASRFRESLPPPYFGRDIFCKNSFPDPSYKLFQVIIGPELQTDELAGSAVQPGTWCQYIILFPEVVGKGSSHEDDCPGGNCDE
jgi:hypothetical protein